MQDLSKLLKVLTSDSEDKSVSDVDNKLQIMILSAIDEKNLTEEEIVKKLGYIPKKQHQALLRLKRVLRLADLGIVNTKQSGFDMKYSSAEFVEAICKAVELETAEYKPLIADLEKYADKVFHAKRPDVCARLRLNDEYTSSFGIAMILYEKYKVVRFAKSVGLLERDEQLKIVKKAIDQHYKEKTGDIPYDGVIIGYDVTLYYDEQEESLYIEV